MAAEDLRTRLVDAALACFADYGARKTSLSDVADRAGVSRSTAYRVFAGKPGLMTQVAEVEAGRYLATMDATVDWSAGAPSALRAAVAFTLEYFRTHTALQRVLREEPEQLIDVLVERPGRPAPLTMLIEAGAHIIERSLDVSGLRVTPHVASEWAVRVIYSLLLAPSTRLDDPDRISDLLLRGIAAR